VRLTVLVAALTCAVELGAQIPQAEYAQRRAALANSLRGDGVVVVAGADEPTLDYMRFFQDPAMLYLTGIREAGAALVLARLNGAVTSTLFVLRRDPAAEVWTGMRMGTAAAARLTSVPAREAGDLPVVMDSLARLGLPFYVVASGATDPLPRDFRARYPNLSITVANGLVERLRGRKSVAELELIRKSVAITVASQEAAMRAARPGMYEYELEAIIEAGFRRAGSDRPSFSSIVGSGPNATTLHYNVNDRRIEPGDVIVMDVGSLYQGYSADVTRTIPVSGRFSPAQREIYQIVRDAQAAAERHAKPGMRAKDMSDSAAAVIGAGLARLGLIESPTATFDVLGANGQWQQSSQVELYYMHGLGHGIGLEVHDPEQFYYTGVIAEGSAFSIEPGIYVRPNLLEIIPDTPRNRALIAKIRPAVERYRNTGVRIEDDYIVTDKGLEWISRAPREIAEIEALMKKPVP